MWDGEIRTPGRRHRGRPGLEGIAATGEEGVRALMGFLCPECSAGSLKIANVIDLPPQGLSDEIQLQILECSRCGLEGAGVYEESRAGALDSEAIIHEGYKLGKEQYESLRARIAQCPQPRNQSCQCPTHRSLGKSYDWWRGLGERLRHWGIDPQGEFPMRWVDPRIGMAPANATQRFLSLDPLAASNWRLALIQLRDVQGLWGGINVFISGSGLASIQVVDEEAIFERRYSFAMEPAQVQRLLALFVEHDFVTIAIPYRWGWPDEANPIITLINAAGHQHTVAKWAGQEHPAFDAIYAQLLAIQPLTEKLQPEYEGPFDWDYVPEWFGPSKSSG